MLLELLTIGIILQIVIWRPKNINIVAVVDCEVSLITLLFAGKS